MRVEENAMKEDEDVGLNSKFPMVTWKPNNLGT
jgi:hypothetical protein